MCVACAYVINAPVSHVQSLHDKSHHANSMSGSEPMETLEDIYIGSVETDRGTREQVRFYDTRGLRDGMEFPRHYYTFADGFVLVYSIDSKESFKRMEALKKDIDRHRDKKEVRTKKGSHPLYPKHNATSICTL